MFLKWTNLAIEQVVKYEMKRRITITVQASFKATIKT